MIISITQKVNGYEYTPLWKNFEKYIETSFSIEINLQFTTVDKYKDSTLKSYTARVYSSLYSNEELFVRFSNEELGSLFLLKFS